MANLLSKKLLQKGTWHIVYLLRPLGETFSKERCYVGSTSSDLRVPRSLHKSYAKGGSRLKVHNFIREVGSEKFYAQHLEWAYGKA